MNTPPTKPTRPFKPITVTLDKEFIHEASGATVWVKKSSHPVPQYEMGLGFLVNEEPRRGHRPVSTARLGKVTMPRLADEIRKLWAEAEDYINGMNQYAEDLRQDAEIERSKPNFKAPPPGLKKIGKMKFDKKGPPRG